MNFNDCINNYRIESVKNRFAGWRTQKNLLYLELLTIVDLIQKATFNRAFKKTLENSKDSSNGFDPNSALSLLQLNSSSKPRILYYFKFKYKCITSSTWSRLSLLLNNLVSQHEINAESGFDFLIATLHGLPIVSLKS
jgi:hypothetical protein